MLLGHSERYWNAFRAEPFRIFRYPGQPSQCMHLAQTTARSSCEGGEISASFLIITHQVLTYKNLQPVTYLAPKISLFSEVLKLPVNGNPCLGVNKQSHFPLAFFLPLPWLTLALARRPPRQAPRWSVRTIVHGLVRLSTLVLLPRSTPCIRHVPPHACPDSTQHPALLEREASSTPRPPAIEHR